MDRLQQIIDERHALENPDEAAPAPPPEPTPRPRPRPSNPGSAPQRPSRQEAAASPFQELPRENMEPGPGVRQRPPRPSVAQTVEPEAKSSGHPGLILLLSGVGLLVLWVALMKAAPSQGLTYLFFLAGPAVMAFLYCRQITHVEPTDYLKTFAFFFLFLCVGRILTYPTLANAQFESMVERELTEGRFQKELVAAEEYADMGTPDGFLDALGVGGGEDATNVYGMVKMSGNLTRKDPDANSSLNKKTREHRIAILSESEMDYEEWREFAYNMERAAHEEQLLVRGNAPWTAFSFNSLAGQAMLPLGFVLAFMVFKLKEGKSEPWEDVPAPSPISLQG